MFFPQENNNQTKYEGGKDNMHRCHDIPVSKLNLEVTYDKVVKYKTIIAFNWHI